MKKYYLIVFISMMSSITYCQLIPSGTYIGLERMSKYSDPSRPQDKWYHLSELNFHGDSVTLEQAPISIYKSDTAYSVSDGGFYKYGGTLKDYKGRLVSSLTLISCDYCALQIVRHSAEENVDDKDSMSNVSNATASPDSVEITFVSSVMYKALIVKNQGKNLKIKVDSVIYRRKEN